VPTEDARDERAPRVRLSYSAGTTATSAAASENHRPSIRHPTAKKSTGRRQCARARPLNWSIATPRITLMKGVRLEPPALVVIVVIAGDPGPLPRGSFPRREEQDVSRRQTPGGTCARTWGPFTRRVLGLAIAPGMCRAPSESHLTIAFVEREPAGDGRRRPEVRRRKSWRNVSQNETRRLRSRSARSRGRRRRRGVYAEVGPGKAASSAPGPRSRRTLAGEIRHCRSR